MRNDSDVATEETIFLFAHDRVASVARPAVTAAEAMDKLHTWASGRCLSASQAGLFHRDGQPAPKPGRRVSRNPSQN